MKNNNPLLPELRFPEFINDGEWEEKELEEILVKNSTKNKLSKYSLVQSVSNKYGFINQDEYFDNRRVASIDTANYYVIEQGTFAYNPSRIDVGSLAYKKDSETSIISPLYVSFKVKNKLINDEFLLSWFSSENFKKQMIFEGGVRNTLNFENLIKIRVNIPKNPLEQQKIADCLSSLDALLTAHTEKLMLLQNHKKGLLQNLFPQGDSKTPEYRFKEFEKDGEWEEKKLGEIVSIITEKVGNRKFTLISIDSGVGLISQIEKFGREIAGNSYSNYIVIKKDDFAFNKSSTKVFPEGQISILDKYEAGAVPNSIFTCFRVKKEEVFPYYLKFLFDNNLHGKWLRKYIAIGARANGALNVNNSDLLELKIPLPKILEQQKIADTLSALDDLINAQTQKIAELQNHKKGLLQGLFPKINS